MPKTKPARPGSRTPRCVGCGKELPLHDGYPPSVCPVCLAAQRFEEDVLVSRSRELGSSPPMSWKRPLIVVLCGAGFGMFFGVGAAVMKNIRQPTSLGQFVLDTIIYPPVCGILCAFIALLAVMRSFIRKSIEP
jgi:hypothetical protein